MKNGVGNGLTGNMSGNCNGNGNGNGNTIGSGNDNNSKFNKVMWMQESAYVNHHQNNSIEKFK